MGKGGDTTTTTTTGDLPEYIKPYVTDLLERSQDVSKLPYQTYDNPRLADFSSDTQQSFDMVRQTAQAGTPAGVTQGQQTAAGISGYQANPFSTQGVPDMDVQQYMNPYVQNVLDVQKQRATQTYGEQQAGRNAAAVAAGAFGGDRRFVQDSLAQRDLNQQMQSMDAEGLASAYDRATGLFTSDQDRALRASMATEEARRLGSALGLDAAKAGVEFGQVGQDMAFQNAEALSNVGAKTQQRDQAGLDLAYQDFVNQRDYPANQLSRYSQMLQGTPVTPTSTSSTTEPAPNFLSQLAGLALGGAGIWDLFN